MDKPRGIQLKENIKITDAQDLLEQASMRLSQLIQQYIGNM